MEKKDDYKLFVQELLSTRIENNTLARVAIMRFERIWDLCKHMGWNPVEVIGGDDGDKYSEVENKRFVPVARH